MDEDDDEDEDKEGGAKAAKSEPTPGSSKDTEPMEESADSEQELGAVGGAEAV